MGDVFKHGKLTRIIRIGKHLVTIWGSSAVIIWGLSAVGKVEESALVELLIE